jgi:hypothetical protein
MQIEIDGVSSPNGPDGEQVELDSTFTLEERADELEVTFKELQAKLRDDSSTLSEPDGSPGSGFTTVPGTAFTADADGLG